MLRARLGQKLKGYWGKIEIVHIFKHGAFSRLKWIIIKVLLTSNIFNQNFSTKICYGNGLWHVKKAILPDFSPFYRDFGSSRQPQAI